MRGAGRGGRDMRGWEGRERTRKLELYSIWLRQELESVLFHFGQNIFQYLNVYCKKTQF